MYLYSYKKKMVLKRLNKITKDSQSVHNAVDTEPTNAQFQILYFNYITTRQLSSLKKEFKANQVPTGYKR